MASERNKFLEILMERDSSALIVKENNPESHVSPHLMAKIDMIQGEGLNFLQVDFFSNF